MTPDSPPDHDETDAPLPVRFLSRKDIANSVPGSSSRPHEAPLMSQDVPFALHSDAIQVEHPEQPFEGIPVSLPNLLDLDCVSAGDPVPHTRLDNSPDQESARLRAELTRSGILRVYAFVAGAAIGAACAAAVLT